MSSEPDWGARQDPIPISELIAEFRWLASLSREPRQVPSPTESLLTHADVVRAWPSILRWSGNNFYTVRVLIGFVSSLPGDWRRRPRAARKSLQRRVAKAMSSCATAAELLERYSEEISAWNEQPASAIARRNNLDLIWMESPGVTGSLQQLLAGDRLTNVRTTLPPMIRLLRNLVSLTDTSKTPLTAAITPTRIGGRTAEVAFYIRALSWYFLVGSGTPEDALVAVFSSALSGEPIDEDRVKKRRKELERQFPQLNRKRRETKTSAKRSTGK